MPCTNTTGGGAADVLDRRGACQAQRLAGGGGSGRTPASATNAIAPPSRPSPASGPSLLSPPTDHRPMLAENPIADATLSICPFVTSDSPVGRHGARSRSRRRDRGALGGAAAAGARNSQSWFSPSRRQLAAILRRPAQRFDTPLAPSGTDFQKRVWAMMCNPHGETATYGGLAMALSPVRAPSAWRAGGNPIPSSSLPPRVQRQRRRGRLLGAAAACRPSAISPLSKASSSWLNLPVTRRPPSLRRDEGPATRTHVRPDHRPERV